MTARVVARADSSLPSAIACCKTRARRAFADRCSRAHADAHGARTRGGGGRRDENLLTGAVGPMACCRCVPGAPAAPNGRPWTPPPAKPPPAATCLPPPSQVPA